MSEYQIVFILKAKKIQKSFSYEAQLYELYVLCSKEFKCGMFILKYNNINLNFLNKTIKLNTFFNKKTLIHEMIIYQLPIPQQSPLKFNSTTNPYEEDEDEQQGNIIYYQKGTLSNMIQSKELTQPIHKLSFPAISIINPSEFSTFFLYFSNMKLKCLKISIQHLIILDTLNSQYSMPLITELKELSIYNKSINDDKSNEQKIILNHVYIQHLNLKSLKIITIDNCTVEFEKNLTSLQKIIMINSFGLTKAIDYSSVSSIELSYNKEDSIFTQLAFLDKQIKTSLNMLKISYDSIELNNCLDIKQLITHSMMLKSFNISLNLKAKFKALDPLEKVTQSFNKVLGNIIELKLCPYTQFNEKDLDCFKGKLSKLVLFKLANHDITNADYFKSFFEANTSDFLSYIDVGIISEDYCDKIYKIKAIDKAFDMKFFPLISIEKITKITLPYIEYNKKTNEITIEGDMIPNETENIELCYLFIKQLFYSLDIITHLKIKSFNQSNSTFLNKVLMYLLNVISSPKIKQITLSNIVIDQSLIDKFSYIFVNSASSLTKIIIDELNFINKDIEYLFHSIVFQVDYLQLNTFAMKNMLIDESAFLILNESNLFEQISNVSFESIGRFDYLEPILIKTTLKGIELKNIDISNKNLQLILKKNRDRLESLSFDLSNDVIDLLQNYSFPNLKELKILSGCMAISDKKRALFLKRRSWHMPQLNHLVISGEISSDMKNIIQAFKYLPMISNY